MSFFSSLPSVCTRSHFSGFCYHAPSLHPGFCPRWVSSLKLAQSSVLLFAAWVRRCQSKRCGSPTQIPSHSDLISNGCIVEVSGAKIGGVLSYHCQLLRVRRTLIKRLSCSGLELFCWWTSLNDWFCCDPVLRFQFSGRRSGSAGFHHSYHRCVPSLGLKHCTCFYINRTSVSPTKKIKGILKEMGLVVMSLLHGWFTAMQMDIMSGTDQFYGNPTATDMEKRKL